MRDVLFLPFADNKELVVATDCSGAIGEKPEDVVSVSDDVVSYAAMRVAMMELLSVGATPSSVILSNFTGDDAWQRYVKGINQALKELSMESLPVIGSTETNFPLMQSALGLTILGFVPIEKKRLNITPDDACYAVIGEPLVGNDVIIKKDKIVPLSIFKKCFKIEGIYEIVPIGSKGILYELQQLLSLNGIKKVVESSPLDLNSSGGPATSFLISYNEQTETAIKQVTGKYYHKLILTEHP